MQLCSSFCFCTPGFDLGHMGKYTMDWIHCTYLELSASAFPIHFPIKGTLLTGLSVQPTNYKNYGRLRVAIETLKESCQHCKI